MSVQSCGLIWKGRGSAVNFARTDSWDVVTDFEYSLQLLKTQHISRAGGFDRPQVSGLPVRVAERPFLRLPKGPPTCTGI